MIVHKNFHEYLINLLKEKVYVLLNILPGEITNSKNDFAYQILLKKEDLGEIIKELQNYTDLSNIQVFTTFRISNAIIELKDNTRVAIEFVHKLVHKSLAYLDEEDLLEHSVMNDQRMSIPSIEHLFEYTILKNFLNNQSLTRKEFEYFEDFHVLVKEDLLEYFNMKYGTTFSNFYHLKKINVRWHYFMGYMKQARII